MWDTSNDWPKRRSPRPSAALGSFYDNALAETIIRFFKAEVIHGRSLSRSFAAVDYATLEWVDWVTNCGLLAPIGNTPPAEIEANVYTVLERADMAA